MTSDAHGGAGCGTRSLRVLCCRDYLPEFAATAAAEGWADVTVAAFEPRCRPPLAWSDLESLAGDDRADVLVLGGACLAALDVPAERRDAVRRHLRPQCLELVASGPVVAGALARNAFLVTPGWLADWRAHLSARGLEGPAAAALFRGFARELVLLDTGVSPEAPTRLAELGRTLALPCTRTPVDLEPARLLLARLVAEWRGDAERCAAAPATPSP